MATKTHHISIKVTADESVPAKKVAEVIGKVIGYGFHEANTDLKYGDDMDDLETAKIASELGTSEPTATRPRVLVVVSGGVADPVYDEGVDVEVFDWDNYKDDPEGTGPAPARFADMAERIGVPVEGDAS